MTDEIYGPAAKRPKGENVSSIPQRYAHHFDQAWKERHRRGQVGTSGHLILKTDGLGVRLPKDGCYGLDGAGDFMPESEMRDDPGLNELPKESMQDATTAIDKAIATLGDFEATLDRVFDGKVLVPRETLLQAAQEMEALAKQLATATARITELEAARDAFRSTLEKIRDYEYGAHYADEGFYEMIALARAALREGEDA